MEGIAKTKKSEDASITVVVRFKQEKDQRDESDWIIDSDAGTVSITQVPSKPPTIFQYDGVTFDMTQKQIYDSFAKPSIIKFMEGFNGTIFTYGQTSSGKTYTMLGPESVTESIVKDVHNIPNEVKTMFGIMPRSIFTIFDGINDGIKQGSSFTLKCSYIEIYNENIHDLLSKSKDSQNLRMREHKFQGWLVEGLEEKYVKEPEEILGWLSVGTLHRSVSATKMNERSSRSHTVFTLTLEQKLFDGSTRCSKLNLVDLAGSEKIDATSQTSGQEETKNINKSLYYLQTCIMSLSGAKSAAASSTGGEKYVNFRNSKLTKILKDALGGNSKTSLICAASMNRIHQSDTLQTLKFAARAKLIKNRITNNVKRSAEELELLLLNSSKKLLRMKKVIQDMLLAASSTTETQVYKAMQDIVAQAETVNSAANTVKLVDTNSMRESEDKQQLEDVTKKENDKKGKDKHESKKLDDDEEDGMVEEGESGMMEDASGESHSQLQVRFLEMEKQYKEIIRQTVDEIEEMNRQRQLEAETVMREMQANDEMSQREIESLNSMIAELQAQNDRVYEELQLEKAMREEKHHEDLTQLAERNHLSELLANKLDEYKSQYMEGLAGIRARDEEIENMQHELNAMEDTLARNELEIVELNEIKIAQSATIESIQAELFAARNDSSYKDDAIQLKIQAILKLQEKIQLLEQGGNYNGIVVIDRTESVGENQTKKCEDFEGKNNSNGQGIQAADYDNDDKRLIEDSLLLSQKQKLTVRGIQVDSDLRGDAAAAVGNTELKYSKNNNNNVGYSSLQLEDDSQLLGLNCDEEFDKFSSVRDRGNQIRSKLISGFYNGGGGGGESQSGSAIIGSANGLSDVRPSGVIQRVSVLSEAVNAGGDQSLSLEFLKELEVLRAQNNELRKQNAGLAERLAELERKSSTGAVVGNPSMSLGTIRGGGGIQLQQQQNNNNNSNQSSFFLHNRRTNSSSSMAQMLSRQSYVPINGVNNTANVAVNEYSTPVSFDGMSDSMISKMFSDILQRIKEEKKEISITRSELDLKHERIRHTIDLQKRHLQNDLRSNSNNEQLFQQIEHHMLSYQSAHRELESMMLKRKQRSDEVTKRIVSHRRVMSRSIFSASKHLIHSIVKIPNQYQMFSDKAGDDRSNQKQSSGGNSKYSDVGKQSKSSLIQPFRQEGEVGDMQIELDLNERDGRGNIAFEDRRLDGDDMEDYDNYEERMQSIRKLVGRNNHGSDDGNQDDEEESQDDGSPMQQLNFECLSELEDSLSCIENIKLNEESNLQTDSKKDQIHLGNRDNESSQEKKETF